MTEDYIHDYIHDYVPRPEFERFCAQQNGSLNRIESMVNNGFAGIHAKLDAMADAINQRVTWEAYDRQKTECKQEFGKLRERLSPGMTLALTLLCSLTTGLIVGILVAVIK